MMPLILALQSPADAPGEGVELIESAAAEDTRLRASSDRNCMGVGPPVLEIVISFACGQQFTVHEAEVKM